jgi:CTP-dependent riboflavin kinase
MLRGTVVSGEGWHSRNMEHWGVLPFAAFPGTLNVAVGDGAVEMMLKRSGGSVVRDGVTYRYWFGFVGDVEVAVTWNVGCALGVLELVAPVRLRNLPLSDGDTVEVRV